MRLNENIKIVSKNIILVPYEPKHVERYHEWMKSSELQELTASEPLTLDEEYEMQKSWRNDEDKCTFLIVERAKYEATENEIESLIGDTNIFLQPFDENENELLGEIEIMIAEQSVRGRGYGLESLLVMLKYGIDYVKCRKFVAKISEKNMKSINLFNKIKFREASRSSVFQEITFERDVTEEWVEWLNKEICFNIEKYEN